MKYNKNIILNILSSNFYDQIKNFALECVWDLDETELYDIGYEGAEYADLDYIDKIRVMDYKVNQEKEKEYLSGILEVWAGIDGYIFEDEENTNIYTGSGLHVFGMTFGFWGSQDVYSNLELVSIY